MFLSASNVSLKWNFKGRINEKKCRQDVIVQEELSKTVKMQADKTAIDPQGAAKGRRGQANLIFVFSSHGETKIRWKISA